MVAADGAAMVALKLVKIGNSVGTIMPRELLERMHVGQGDQVFVTEAPDGYRITPHDPAFEEQMLVAQRIMKRDRKILRELAK